MEGDVGRRKRPQRAEDGAVPAVPGDVRDGEVDQQVDKFFALLRSIREMRELRGRPAGFSIPRKKAKVNGPWTPTFQWEDFAVAVSSSSPAGVPAAVAMEGGRRGKEAKEEEGAGLDLKLSL